MDPTRNFWQNVQVRLCCQKHVEVCRLVAFLGLFGCAEPTPNLIPAPLTVVAVVPIATEPRTERLADAGKLLVPESPPIAAVENGRSALEQERFDRAAAREREFPMHGVAFHYLAQVFFEPDMSSGIRGYLRRGNRFRAKSVRGGRGCSKRWFAMDGGGFVCAGRGFVVGKTPQTFPGSPASADTQSALPYRYAKSMFSDVPQYFELPSREDEARAAKAIQDRVDGGDHAMAAQAERVDGGADDGGVADDGLPEHVRSLLQPGFYVSFDRIEETAAGKEFVRTVRGAYVAFDRLQEVTASPEQGVAIADELRHPLSFVFHSETTGYVVSTDGEHLVQGDALPRFTAVSPAGPPIRFETKSLVSVGKGHYVESRALRSAVLRSRPALVPPGGRWIDVDLKQQVLVAYEGDVPVFATLIASGKPGFETPTGFFRIHAKHISTTMDGSGGSDEPYSIEDVPWTMYFQGGLALHAAFWHGRFGRVRSHGCINLAPRDARHLFQWATPERPAGFHGVMGEMRKHGTYVSIHHG